VEEAVFRVAQEALNNVAKHARASHVALSLTISDEVVDLVVQDNGVGFDPGATQAPVRRSLGMTSMQERAALLGGVCTVTSAPGAGTTVHLRVPPTGMR
jgi:signal transduction histidine kinase